MEFLPNLWNAWLQRIRAPIIGAISLSFIAINWQPIWYLLFADQPVRQKFLFFDANTSISTLIFYPVIVGVLLAMTSPWLRLVGTWWTQFPISRIRRIQSDRDHDQKVHQEYLLKKQAIAATERVEAEADLHAKQDEAIISAETRRQKATIVGGDTLKADLEKDRWQNRLSEIAQTLLSEASREDGEIQVTSFLGGTRIRAGHFTLPSPDDPRTSGKDGPRELAKIEAGISELENQNLIRSQNAENTYFKITELGYEVSDLLSSNHPALTDSYTAPNGDKWKIYQDAAGHWKWRRTASNNNIVGASGESYRHRSDCIANAKRNGMEGTPS